MATNNPNSRKCRISLKDIFKLCSSAFVPLMIGIMTLVISVQQHKQGNANRLNDLKIAKESREQQLQLEEARRLQDREAEEIYRNQSHIFEEQKRQQDRRLDIKHRQQSLQISNETRQDLILSTYLNDISQLLIEFNFVLNKNLRNIIVRPKTLIALHQLDSTRKMLILEFLYYSNFIRGPTTNFETYGLDLTEADFNGVNLTNTDMEYRILYDLSLTGAQLINSSFDNCYIDGSNFEKALINGASFKGANLREVKFYHASLVNVDFTNANLTRADLRLSNLTDAIITDEQLFSTKSYHRAIFPNGTKALHENFIINGYPNDCTLNNWTVLIKDRIELIPVNNDSCMFQTNASENDATICQRITSSMFQSLFNEWIFHIQFEMHVKKILQSNNSSYIKLAILFYDANGSAFDQKEATFNITSLNVGEYREIRWITDNWRQLPQTNSIESFVIFGHTLAVYDIGLFLEDRSVFLDDVCENCYFINPANWE